MQHLNWTAPHFALLGGHIHLFNYFLEYHNGEHIDLDHRDVVYLPPTVVAGFPPLILLMCIIYYMSQSVTW